MTTAWRAVLVRGAGGLALAWAVGLPLARAAPADAIAGTWLTEDGASKVEVSSAKASDGNVVFGGKVVWLKEPMRDGKPLLDANNLNAALRGRPILGLPILLGFKATDSGWSGGMVYSPRAGKSFPADLELTGDGRLQLKVKAGLLSRVDYWTR
jgi:uncharacterized protein (DUF2147 family)